MKAKTILIILTFFFISCQLSNSNDKKIIKTEGFEIEVPKSWKYKRDKGIDSFVGRITSKEVELHFDWSYMGYANHLIPTMKEYINEDDWDWMPHPPYEKKGIIYTNGDPIKERSRIMKEQGIIDTTEIKVAKIQTPTKEIVFEEGKYIAILTYEDTIQEVNIEIPEKVKKYSFQIDTINGFYRKIVKPKSGNNGITGVYFQDLNSNYNFNLFGKNLSTENQEKAIEAFKTIKIKKE